MTVVQGLIMISTWDASVGRQRECQACAALALRIMIAGGWHLMDHPNGDGCTDSRIKMWGTLERELARRCWWFVWIAEKWTAAILTQYVVSDNWDSISLFCILWRDKQLIPFFS